MQLTCGTMARDFCHTQPQPWSVPASPNCQFNARIRTPVLKLCTQKFNFFALYSINCRIHVWSHTIRRGLRMRASRI
jgi:hypothetical protein